MRSCLAGLRVTIRIAGSLLVSPSRRLQSGALFRAVRGQSLPILESVRIREYLFIG